MVARTNQSETARTSGASGTAPQPSTTGRHRAELMAQVTEDHLEQYPASQRQMESKQDLSCVTARNLQAYPPAGSAPSTVNAVIDDRPVPRTNRTIDWFPDLSSVSSSASPPMPTPEGRPSSHHPSGFPSVVAPASVWPDQCQRDDSGIQPSPPPPPVPSAPTGERRVVHLEKWVNLSIIHI